MDYHSTEGSQVDKRKKMLTTKKDVCIARCIESSGASDDDKNYDIRRHNR